ncbi:MAG: hypothetical protein WCY09_08015 [Candidatus Omnitrophota bacterium]
MTVRLDLINGIKADMHSWFWEAADPVYKKLNKFYPDMAEVNSIKDIKGGYWKGTSAIGATELESRDDYGVTHEDRPVEGYPVYARIKQKSLKVKVPREFDRDWHRTKEFLRDYVKKSWPLALEVTKEKIVAAIYNKGGFTSGDSETFNQNSADLGLTTYTSPNLGYDGKPFFALTSNNHTAKSGSTYYNALALSGVTFANAKTMHTLLTATNAYMENGQPFDNSQDLVITCAPALALDWEAVNNSTLNPDNAENAVNTLKGAFKKIISNPYITTATQSVMHRRAMGVKVWFGEPKFSFWEENDPPSKWARIDLDYAICVQNFRTHIGNNCPTS